MMIRRAFRQFYKFSEFNQNIKQTEPIDLPSYQQTEPIDLSSTKQNTKSLPVYLRPYDKAKYEVLSPKIKKNSGYALLQIQPFPRARIMRLCYNILQELKIGIPQDFIQRIYLQERIKYVMEVTDQVEDIEELEYIFATDSIELFIVVLARHIQYIPIIRKMKMWEKKITPQESPLDKVIRPQSKKYPIYKKGERLPDNFLDI